MRSTQDRRGRHRRAVHAVMSVSAVISAPIEPVPLSVIQVPMTVLETL